jgi:hypothetical protein
MSDDGKTITFTSENIENISAGWRARETYKVISTDEFIEIFEFGGTGQGFRKIYREPLSA